MPWGAYVEADGISRLGIKKSRDEAIDILDLLVPFPSSTVMVENLYEESEFYGYFVKTHLGATMKMYVKKIKK